MGRRPRKLRGLLAVVALGWLLCSCGTTVSSEPGNTETPAASDRETPSASPTPGASASTTEPTPSPKSTFDPVEGPFPAELLIDHSYCHAEFGNKVNVTLIAYISPGGSYWGHSLRIVPHSTAHDGSIRLTRPDSEYDPGDAITWTSDGGVEIVAVLATWVDRQGHTTPPETLRGNPTTIGATPDWPVVHQVVVCGKNPAYL